MKIEHNRVVLILRSTLFWIWSITNTLVMGIPVLGGRLVSYRLSSKMSNVWSGVNLIGLKYICGVTWKVEGRENIPDHACLVLSKHQSTWETYFIYMLVPRSVYVAKKSLSYVPIFGWSLLALNFILIDRSKGRSAISQMVTQARERLAENISIIIFPEGTRRPVGAKPNYRVGGGILAAETGSDVLPIAMNSGEFWPRHGYIKWPGEITMTIGPIIKPDGKSAEQIMAETEQWIEGRMAEITVRDRFPY